MKRNCGGTFTKPERSPRLIDECLDCADPKAPAAVAMQRQTRTGSQLRSTAETRENLGRVPQWRLSTRVGFRFAFVYLALYTLPFPFNLDNTPDALGVVWHRAVPWIARVAFHLNIPITLGAEPMYEYARTLLFVALAFVSALVWSLADRKRPHYRTLHDWLRLYLRLYLGTMMLIYGASKVLPGQFAPVFPSRLVQPYGDSSLQGVLWTLMGVSRPYSVFGGLAEVVGGALLFFPALTTLGALLCSAVMTNVFMLNMCYDVSVKGFSFNLLAMSLFLLVPDLRSLTDLLIFRRPTKPPASQPLFRRRWLYYALLTVQLGFGGYAAVYSFAQAHNEARDWAEAPTKTLHYGIWFVDDFTLDGKVQPPVISNEQRWWRVIFDFPEATTIQFVGGHERRFFTKTDSTRNVYQLTEVENSNSTGELVFSEGPAGQLTLDGQLNGQRVHATLHRTQMKSYLTSQRTRLIHDELSTNR